MLFWFGENDREVNFQGFVPVSRSIDNSKWYQVSLTIKNLPNSCLVKIPSQTASKDDSVRYQDCFVREDYGCCGVPVNSSGVMCFPMGKMDQRSVVVFQ